MILSWRIYAPGVAMQATIILLAMLILALAGASLSMADQPPPSPQGQDTLPCGDQSTVLMRLYHEFGERPQAAGMTEHGGIMLLTATDNGATWTLLLLIGPKLACILTSGTDWKVKPAGGNY